MGGVQRQRAQEWHPRGRCREQVSPQVSWLSPGGSLGVEVGKGLCSGRRKGRGKALEDDSLPILGLACAGGLGMELEEQECCPA